MRKPEQQWETRRHRAIRQASPKRLAGEPRAEAFVLELDEGASGWAELGLERQIADERGASDPDLAHAVAAWLIARGQRRIALHDEQGRVLVEGPIQPRSLGVETLATVPTRLISLCPSNLECLWALGCFERVIACEDSSDFPPGVEQLERLGPDLGPNLDRVAELAPDLVVSSLTVPGMERVVTGLRARGIPQVVLAPRSIADVLDELRSLGRLLGVDERARAEVERMRAEIAELERDVGEPARVYLEWWPRPMYTPGSTCYSNELIRLAGGVNVFGDRPGSSVEVQAEELLAADPEVCFVSWCGVAADKLDPRRLIERPGLEHLRAARLGHVLPLDERYSGRPGPRMLEAARIMAAGIRMARARGN